MKRTVGDHNLAIRDAGRDVLAPLGLVQKGRSRTWLDDRLWHVIVVDFQHSSWGKGSYLNVGVMWLWWSKDYISFDYGLVGPQQWESAESPDFAAKARSLAAVAAKRVEALREEVGTLRAASRALTKDPAPGWPHLHAGIAAGLVGDNKTAARLLGDLARYPATYDWERVLTERASELREMLDDATAFQDSVVKEIVACRAALHLGRRDENELRAAFEHGS